MNDSLNRAEVPRTVGAAEIPRRINPLQEGSSERNPDWQDQKKEKKFHKSQTPEDQVNISAEAWDALKQTRQTPDPD